MDEDDDFDDFEEATYAPAAADSEGVPPPQTTEQSTGSPSLPEFDLSALSSGMGDSLSASNHFSSMTNQPQTQHSVPSDPFQALNSVEIAPEVPTLAHHHSTPLATEAAPGVAWGGEMMGGLDWSTAGTGVKTEVAAEGDVSPTLNSGPKTEKGEGNFEWGLMGAVNSDPIINLDFTSPSMSLHGSTEPAAISLNVNQQQSPAIEPAIDHSEDKPVDNDQPEIWEEETSPNGNVVILQKQEYQQEPAYEVEQPQQPESMDRAPIEVIMEAPFISQTVPAEPEPAEEEQERKESDEFEFQTAEQPIVPPEAPPEFQELSQPSQPPPAMDSNTGSLDFDFLGQSPPNPLQQPQPPPQELFQQPVALEQASERKESDDFEFQEAPPSQVQLPEVQQEFQGREQVGVHDEANAPETIPKEIEWDFAPVNPVIVNPEPTVSTDVNNVVETGNLQTKQSGIEEENKEPPIKPQSNVQAEQEDDDDFGDFEEGVGEAPVETVEAPPASPVPPPLPADPDNTVQIEAHVLQASPDLEEVRVELQRMVDRLPDYSFLVESAFLTLP